VQSQAGYQVNDALRGQLLTAKDDNNRLSGRVAALMAELAEVQKRLDNEAGLRVKVEQEYTVSEWGVTSTKGV
jgi:hypothetical protein